MCLVKNPEERLTIEQVLEHEFLAGAEACREAWISEYEQWLAQLN